MRILLIPRIEWVDGGNSLTLCPVFLVKAFLEIDKKVQFVLPIHERFNYYNWLKNYDLMSNIGNITLLPLSSTILGDKPNARKLSHCIGSALMNKIGPMSDSCQFIDIAIGDGVFASNCAIRTALQGSFGRGYSRTIPYIGWAEWVATESWPGLWNEFDAKAEMWGSLVCDHVVWQSYGVRDDYIQCLRKYLNSSVIASILNKSSVVQTGVLCDRITPKFYQGGKPVALWAGYSDEDYKICVPALMEALKRNKVSKVILVFMGGHFGRVPPKEEIDSYRRLSNVEVYEEIPHFDFLKLIEEADIFCSFKVGTYGIRYAECMYAGAFPIVAEGTVKNLLPESWKFGVPSPGRMTDYLLAGIAYLAKNPNSAREISDHIYKNHNVAKEYRKFYHICQRLVKEEIARTNFGDFDRLAMEVFPQYGELLHQEVVDKLDKVSKTKTSLLKNALIPPGFVRWLMISLGWEDVGTNYPYYRKIEKCES